MQTVSFQSLKSELTCNGCPFWFVLFSCERLHHGCSVQKRILGYGFNSVTHNFSLPISIMQFGRMVVCCRQVLFVSSSGFSSWFLFISSNRKRL